MFNNKVDVDRHVKDIFNKLNTDSERDAKCYMLAKLYFKVKDYDSAIKYVNRYIINVRNSAQAQKFLGECYEALKQPSKALDAYRTSLELDGGQRDLVLKVCDLLSDPELPLVTSVASYWLDRLQGLFPKHPIVFKLRERLVRADPGVQKDPRELESLILSEIMARPHAPEVRIRFFDFLIESGKVSTATKQVFELIALNLFPDHLPWFECLHRVLETREKENIEDTMEYLVIKLTVLERCSYLSLQDFGPDKRSNVECTLAVFRFDQGLHSISNFKPKLSDKLFFDSVLDHFRAQLASHLAVLLLRRAKSEPGTWQRAMRSASPLLTIATKQTELIDKQETKLMGQWRVQGAERVAVAAHVLLAWGDGNAQYLEEVYKSCGGKWRERTYEKIFYNKEYLDASNTSHFLNNSLFLDLPTALPSSEDLEHVEKEAQFAHPGSLHHMAWLGLANSVSKELIKPSFVCHVFPNLQNAVNNIENASPDAINRFDIDTFLYATVFCAKKGQESRPNGDYPKLLPVGITKDLCTLHQAEWWLLVNKLCTKTSTAISCDQRLRLRKGIETVRVVGAHGLHPKLLYHLAQQFRLRFDKTEDGEERTALGERVEILWKATLPLLERLIKQQPIREIGSKLFDYGLTDWFYKDVENALEDGKIFLAQQLISAGKYEEALDGLIEISTPHALYHQAVIYKKLAEELLKTSKNSSNSGELMRMLRKSRNALDDAENAMRQGGVAHLSELKQRVEKTGEEIESLFAQLGVESDGLRQANQHLDRVIRQAVAVHSTPKLIRTPTTVENLNVSGNYNAPDNDGIKEALQLLRSDVGDVKSLLQEFLAEFKKMAYKLVERHEMDDILNSEDFAREEGYDEQTQTYYNIPETSAQRAVHSVPVVVPTPYGTLQQYLPGMIWPGSLPFSEGQQLPDFRSLQTQPVLSAPLPSNPPVQSNVPGPTAPQTDLSSKIVPNVVVTSSATLPTYSKTPQPPMAVTIPPEHVRGGIKPLDPQPNSHAFQLSISKSQNSSKPITVQSPSDKYQARTYEQSAEIFQSNLQKALSNSSTEKNTSPQSNKSTLDESGAKYFGADAELCLNRMKSPKEWLKGKLEVMYDNIQNCVRVTMTQDKKILLDLQITPNMVLSRKSDTISSWSTADYGYGDSILQEFLVRFKTPADTKEFEAVFNLNRKLLETTFPNLTKEIKTPPTRAVIAPASFSFTPKTPAAATTTPPKNETSFDGLASTESTVFGNKVSSGFNFTALAQSGKVSNAFASASDFKGFAGMGQPLFASNSANNQNDSKDNNVSGEEEKEYEPNVEFVPVIPLPDLVEVKTGEEDEEKIYEERAKILKYVAETREWKEKGRGNVKLLKHPETGKIRIIMRRDQVHKVCCNHYLDESMKFQRMASSIKAATWSAQDFSSGELTPELLAIQFNKPEILNTFLELIEKLQKEMRDGSAAKKSTSSKKSTENSESGKSLSELFKKAPGSWECDLCLVLNKPDVKKCIACETLRPGEVADKPAVTTTTTPSSGFSFGIPSSNTPTPTKFSFGNTTANESKSALFSFGNSPTTAFNFGTTNTKPFTFGVTTPVQKESSDYKIGSSDNFCFKFNKSINKSDGELDASKSDDDVNDVEHEDENLTFKPVIPLPEKVPLHTGEEDEDVVFTHRAKLFRYHEKEWRERGLGDIKILKHKETKKVRLLMRREQIFKICLNCLLAKDMEFTAKDHRSWIWTATDFAEGTASQELFCIKFRDEETAGRFKKAVDDELASLVTTPQRSNTVTENLESTTRAGSAARALFNDDIEKVYEYTATAEDEAEAKRLQLPPSFYRYKEAKPCAGCIGCENDESSDDSSKAFTPLGQLPKPEVIFSKLAKTPPKPESEEKPKSSVFANFSFSSALDKQVGGTNASAPIFGSASGSIFGNTSTETTKSSVFGGSSTFGTASTSSIFGGAKNLNDPKNAVFTANSNLSFANLAKNATDFKSTGAPSWDTTVKPIVSQIQQKKNDDESGNDGSDEDADDSYDPQYKPIVDLPDAIEVKTGEEDEVKRFSERAKLFRFDTETKEWKERGTGEIKILHHVENGSYRILMRREQVLNTICNMRIVSSLTLQDKSTKGWMWQGTNHLDGTPAYENLAVKFKSEESAKHFKEVVDKCLAELAKLSPVHLDDESDDEYGPSDDDENVTNEGEEMVMVKQGVSMRFSNEDTGKHGLLHAEKMLSIWETANQDLKFVIYEDDDDDEEEEDVLAEVRIRPSLDQICKIGPKSISVAVLEYEPRNKYIYDFKSEDDVNEICDYIASLKKMANSVS